MIEKNTQSISERLDQAIARGVNDITNKPDILPGLPDVARALSASDTALSEMIGKLIDYPSLIARLKVQNAEIHAVVRETNKVARLIRRLRFLVFWRQWGTAISVILVVLAIVSWPVYVYREPIREWLRPQGGQVKPATPANPATTPAPATSASTVPGGKT